jgi:hypothetical protein
MEQLLRRLLEWILLKSFESTAYSPKIASGLESQFIPLATVVDIYLIRFNQMAL